jgi:hypothetical protein
MTSHLEAHCHGDQDHISHNPKVDSPPNLLCLTKVHVFVFIFAVQFSLCTPMHACTAIGRCRALLATIECSRGTTMDQEDVEGEDDMLPPLEGEDDKDEGALPVVSLIALQQ